VRAVVSGSQGVAIPLLHKRIEASEIWEKRNPENFRGWLAKRRNLSVAETARMSEGFFGTSDLKLLEKGTSEILRKPKRHFAA